MFGGLVTLADSMNTSLGMELSITSKLEGVSGWLWGSRGSVVRALVAKARGLKFDSRWLPGCFPDVSLIGLTLLYS